MPEAPAVPRQDPTRRALLLLLTAAFALVVLVFSSLAADLFLAAVLASVLWPLHQRLTRFLRHRPAAAAGLLVFAVVVVMVGPVVGLSAVVVRQGAEAARFVSRTVHSERVLTAVERLPDPLKRGVVQVLDAIPTIDGPGDRSTPPSGPTPPAPTSPDPGDAKGPEPSAGSGIGRLAGAAKSALTATGSVLFHAAMMLIALYFFLAEETRLLPWVEEASPLRPGQSRELLRELRNVAGAVLRSTVLTAFVQALVAFVGFLLAHVPQPIFFSLVTFFFALIPAVGAAAVSLLAAGLLLITGHTGHAIFLAIWGVVLVGLVDNVVKPLLVRGGRGVELHGGVVFFSLIGGLAVFGMIGLLIGPLAVALFVACLRIYRRDFGKPAADSPALVTAPVADLPGPSAP